VSSNHWRFLPAKIMSLFASVFPGYIKALLLAAVVFIPFERLAGAQPAQRILRRGSATDVLTGFMNGLLLYGVLLAAITGLDGLAAFSAPHLRIWVATRPFWAQAVLAIAVGDLGIYGIHRLAHTVPWLWRFHAIHHSAEEMDWLVAARNHPVDLLLFRVASLGPLVMLHVTPAAFGAFVVVIGWQSWLAHANVRLQYGPLRHVLVSPDFHHWHHSAEREAHNKNYAGLLACWDVLFGTIYLPRGGRPLHYGVDERIPAGYVNQLFHPFRRNPRLQTRTARRTSCGTPAET
jgi:sterol desaturase/sphingolipid hydroxylase (fatty acid hydroxylase superfamily)